MNEGYEGKGDANKPAVEEVVPAYAMPVVDSAGCDTADVRAGFPNNRETALELADAVSLAEGGEVGAGA
jgi:hypothetical protein